MFITIINDCKSENDIGRQATRYSWLFPGSNINFVGIDSSLGINATLEAAGNLVDVLDASEGQEGIVALNVAPRGQTKEDGHNGSRFSFFWYKKTLVVSTIKGFNLSLIKKLNLTKKIDILETDGVLDFSLSQKLVDEDLSDYIRNSQFRSFDFQPRVARWLSDGYEIPSEPLTIDKVADSPNTIWLIDSFGNAKTTLLVEDLPAYINNSLTSKDQLLKVSTNLGVFNYYHRLKDVPDKETAIYSGSSGIADKRFLEIATQNTTGSAAKKLNLKVGDVIEIR